MPGSLNSESEGLMGTLEAAQELGCSQQTIVNMIKDGRLRGVDRGQGARPRWLVARSSLRARQAPPSPAGASAHDVRVEQLEREVKRLSRMAWHLAAAVVDLGAALREQGEGVASPGWGGQLSSLESRWPPSPDGPGPTGDG